MTPDTNPDPVKALLEACEPFEHVAEHDIGDGEADTDWFVVSFSCPRRLTVRDFRALSRAASVLREREGGEDYYPSHEALIDLVSLLGEREAIGGGPGFAERWKEAYDNACDLVRVEP